MQLLLLTLDEGYFLMAAPPDLERGVAPLGPPAPSQLLLLTLDEWYLLIATPPDLEHGVTVGCERASEGRHTEIIITEN